MTIEQSELDLHINNLEALFNAALPQVIAEVERRESLKQTEEQIDRIAHMSATAACKAYSEKLAEQNDAEFASVGLHICEAWKAIKLNR